MTQKLFLSALMDFVVAGALVLTAFWIGAQILLLRQAVFGNRRRSQRLLERTENGRPLECGPLKYMGGDPSCARAGCPRRAVTVFHFGIFSKLP